MPKTGRTISLEPEMWRALENEAQENCRSVSQQIELILTRSLMGTKKKKLAAKS